MMKITIMSILTSILLLAGTASAFTYDQYTTLELDLACNNVIGVMPHVEIQSTPNTEICVQWFDWGEPASVPNGDWNISSYCRITDSSGYTFFAYRARFVYYYPITYKEEGCTNLSWDATGMSQEFSNYNLELEILSINGNPDFTFIPVPL